MGQIIAGTLRAYNDGKGFREIKTKDKMGTLCARARNDGDMQAVIKINVSPPMIRRLTPTECARLQTVPEWYKWACSNTQQYKMLGNGWTIEVIKHILSFLPETMPGSVIVEQTGGQPPKCGNCLLCIHTHLGGECRLSDNPVDYNQDGCIDHISED